MDISASLFHTLEEFLGAFDEPKGNFYLVKLVIVDNQHSGIIIVVKHLATFRVQLDN